MKYLLALLLALGFLTACGDPIESGTVIAKQYDDPDDWTTREEDSEYSCKYEYGYNPASGNYEFANICKDRVTGHHTEYHHDGPHWRLRIRDDKDSGHKEWIEVSESEYEKFGRGGHWPDPR